MADSILGTVIEHLASDDPSVRNIALNWLCEGYVDDPGVAEAVFQQWKTRSFEQAFPEFPMLAYFPISASQVSQACHVASEMIAKKAGLTSTTTRCAGKLMEQLVRLPAGDLADHMQQITALVGSHKIFFRIDLQGLRQRLELLQQSSSQLTELLESSITTLVSSPQDEPARQRAQQALEALRLLYPEQLDLGRCLQPDTATPADSVSCELALHSLCHFPDNSGVESQLGQLLHSSAQSVLSLAVEALVRSGTGEAARVLVDSFHEVSPPNQPWIARGLQRMRVHNLAPLIGELRSKTSDETLRTMMLVAELQQLDPRESQRISQLFDQLDSVTPHLLDAGMLYTFVCGPLQQSPATNELEESYRDLLIRVQMAQSQSSSAVDGSSEDTSDAAENKRALRRQQAKQIGKLFKKG